MIKVGITGGIGSGKSIVCKIFKTLGIPVFTADIEARSIINTDEGVAESLMQKFGKDLYIYEGLVDGKKLATYMFSDVVAMKFVNSVVHPVVLEKYNEWTALQITEYCIIETAILYESGVNKFVDKVITVSSPENIRIERTMERDRINKEEVLTRIGSQLPDDEKIKLADYIIYNNNTKLVVPQVMKIHEELKNNARYSQK